MAGGDILDRMRLVKNDEVLCEENSLLAILDFALASNEREEESVIEHDKVRRLHPAAQRLIEAARVPGAALLSADMLLASHLLPDLRVGLLLKIAKRPIARRETPLADSIKFGALPGSEEVTGLRERTLKPGSTKEIMPSLQQDSFELDREQFLDERDILVDELLLEGNGVSRNDRFAPGSNGMQG
jgi:hypothetical protein